MDTGAGTSSMADPFTGIADIRESEGATAENISFVAFDWEK